MMFVVFNDIFVACLVSCPKYINVIHLFSLGVCFGVTLVMDEKTSVSLSEFPTERSMTTGSMLKIESSNFLGKT
jgi:hypothetical protein